MGRFATAQSGVEPCGLRIGGVSKLVSSKSSKEKQKAIEYISNYAAEHEDVRFDLVVTNPKVEKGTQAKPGLRLIKTAAGTFG